MLALGTSSARNYLLYSWLTLAVLSGVLVGSLLPQDRKKRQCLYVAASALSAVVSAALGFVGFRLVTDSAVQADCNGAAKHPNSVDCRRIPALLYLSLP